MEDNPTKIYPRPPADIGLAVSLVVKELGRAQSRFPKFQSAHEGYAVILEEMDELWEEIKACKWDRPGVDMSKINTEAVQVAAMAMRFIVDICDVEEMQ